MSTVEPQPPAGDPAPESGVPAPAPKSRLARRYWYLAGVAALVVVAVLVLSFVRSAQVPGPTDDERGAVAAVQAYVDAIAAGDVTTADAMTDQQYLDVYAGDDTDIRQALPSATELITDVWVDSIGTDRYGYYSGRTFLVSVSYRLGDLTGGGVVEVSRNEDGDPADLSTWEITRPLLGGDHVFAGDYASALSVGGVDLPDDQAVAVWGYPARYAIESADVGPYLEQTAEVEVVLGATDLEAWDRPFDSVTFGATEELVDAVTSDLLGSLQACADSAAVSSAECGALPEVWSVPAMVSDIDIEAGHWDYEAPVIAVDDDLTFLITGGGMAYVIEQGSNSVTGEDLSGSRIVSVYLVQSGEIHVDGEQYTIEWWW